MEKQLVQVQAYTDRGEAMVGKTAVNPKYIISIIPTGPGKISLMLINQTRLVVDDDCFEELAESTGGKK